LNIIVDNIHNFTEAKYYSDLNVKKIILSQDNNRNAALIRQISLKLNVELELVANDFSLFQNPISMASTLSNNHASQAPHQNEGFVLAYYLSKDFKEKMSNPVQYLRSPWIRPEDLNKYEKLGVNSIKIVDRNAKSIWINKVVDAYLSRDYAGNLLDLLSCMDKKSTESANLMVIERPDHANSNFSKSVYDLIDNNQAYLDNKKLDGFIDPILDSNIDCQYCCGCTHCDTYKNKAFKVDEEWAQAKIYKSDRYITQILNGNAFEAEEGFKVQQIKWPDDIKGYFDKIIEAKPDFVREVAREGIAKKAESNARERKSFVVELIDVINANLSETPEPFRNESMKQMRGIGIDLEKYLGTEEVTPAAAAENKEEKSDTESPFKDAEQFWGLISTFLTSLNEDPNAKKFIPSGNITKVQYVISDIDFCYVEYIGQEKVGFEKGKVSDPDVTLTMDSLTYHEIMSGKIHPIQASEAKRSKVDGPVFKLVKIQNVLTQINQIYPDMAAKYLSAEKPEKPEEPTDSNSLFKSKDDFFDIISKTLTKVNEDPESKKFIPSGGITKLQYIIPDLDFCYVEYIGQGKVDFEKGKISDPDVTLTMDSLTYHEIMSGKIHPIQASEAKRSKVDGPVFKLIKIQNVLTRVNRIYPEIFQNH
jgi:putative sterol carrier protein/collagenase-like PrtC family protease